MIKAEMIERWQGIEPNQVLRPGVIPYKHKGSTFDRDGIRITGSMQWIDAVLSRLTDLLSYEGVDTRLQVSYRQSNDKQGNLIPDAYNCYVQVHQRGSEGAIMQAYMAGDTGKVRKLHEQNLEIAYQGVELWQP